MIKAINLLLILPLFAAACTPAPRWDYVPPAEKKGQTCIEQCKDTFDQCIAQAEAVYDQCLQERQFQDRIFKNCQAGMAGAVPNHSGGCSPPPECSLPQTRECRTTYNQCYESCGGQVTRK